MMRPTGRAWWLLHLDLRNALMHESGMFGPILMGPKLTWHPIGYIKIGV